MVYRCQHCDATLEAEPGRAGEWLECPGCHRFIRLSGPTSEGVTATVVGGSGPVAVVQTLFAFLSVLAVITSGPLLAFWRVASPGYPEARTMAGMALGCSLHFTFLWAVLHLLSRICARLEQGRR